MSPAVRPIGRPGPGRPLVVFPHAGGSPRFYSHWTGRGVRLLGVTYPGRDDRYADRHPARLADLAAAITHELTGVPQPVLFGHSMGALVAYEVAHRLAGIGAEPVLVVSGRDAPRHGAESRGLHRGTDDELLAELTRVDARNADVFAVAELRTLFLPLIREDYRLVETHEPPAPLPRVPRLLVINGTDDPHVTIPGAHRWAACAERFDGVRLVPGAHFHHATPDRACLTLLAGYLAGMPHPPGGSRAELRHSSVPLRPKTAAAPAETRPAAPAGGHRPAVSGGPHLHRPLSGDPAAQRYPAAGHP